MRMTSITRLIIPLFLSVCLTPALVTHAAGNELVFLTWSEYIDPEVIAEFEKRQGIKVSQVYFETDDARDDMLQESSGDIYDVVIVNGSMLESYARRGWLQRIEPGMVPNLSHIDPRWRSAYSQAAEYAVPYIWGTLGIAYREDLVSEPITSWMQLFRPAEDLHGRIVMLSQVRDLIGMALKALGHSANTENPDELAHAEQLLLAQKPFVKDYAYISLSAESVLVKGEIAAVMAFNGDALTLAGHDERIRFVLPREGGNLWCDYLTVMTSSAHKELAYKFIDFLNEPQIAARNAEYLNYATPNSAAKKLLPAEFLANETIYPDAEALARSESYVKLKPRTIKLRNEIFSRVVQ